MVADKKHTVAKFIIGIVLITIFNGTDLQKIKNLVNFKSNYNLRLISKYLLFTLHIL